MRVWKRILGSRQPAAGAGWRLAAITRTAVDELRADRLITGDTWQPQADHVEDIWNYAAWVENLATAAEWQAHPFQGGGKDLEWKNALSGDSATPFRFECDQEADARSVDGAVRLRFAERLSAAPAAPKDETQFNRLDRLAGLLLLLPNSDPNTAIDPLPGTKAIEGDELAKAKKEALIEFAAAKTKFYPRLHAVFAGARSNRVERMRFARLLMCMEISLREGAAVAPSFEKELMPALEREAKNDAQLAESLGNLRDERERILAHLLKKPVSKADDARRRIDGHLKMLPADFYALDKTLVWRSYTERLMALSDEGVRNLLTLRQELIRLLDLVLAAKAEPNTDKEKEQRAEDQRRVATAFDLLDYKLWFTRPDFKAGNYFKLELPDKAKQWWPALTVLAIGDAELHRRAVALCRAGDEPAAAAARLRVFQLNEVIFATCTEVAAHPKAKEMLAFAHELPRGSTLDLKLLAVIRDPPMEATARTLGQACFDGVLTNVDLAKRGAPASDTLLHECFFGSLDAFLGDDRRTMPLVNVDRAVALAAAWETAPAIPPRLQEGAKNFLNTTPERLGALLRGAQAPQAVLAAAQQILARTSASKLARYRGFYDGLLTEGRGLARRFYEAVAEPMFRQDLAAQRKSIEDFLAGWRVVPAPAADGPKLGGALHGGLGSVIERLVRGDGAANQPCLWEPVKAFEKESGVRAKAPREFLELAGWWFALQKPDDRADVAKLFTIEERKP